MIPRPQLYMASLQAVIQFPHFHPLHKACRLEVTCMMLLDDDNPCTGRRVFLVFVFYKYLCTAKINTYWPVIIHVAQLVS